MGCTEALMVISRVIAGRREFIFVITVNYSLVLVWKGYV